MGLCAQLHDNVPKRWIKEDQWKYPLTRNQMDTISELDRMLRYDIEDIEKEWRVVEMICECMDLVKELEMLKQTRAGKAN